MSGVAETVTKRWGSRFARKGESEIPFSSVVLGAGVVSSVVFGAGLVSSVVIGARFASTASSLEAEPSAATSASDGTSSTKMELREEARATSSTKSGATKTRARCMAIRTWVSSFSKHSTESAGS